MSATRIYVVLGVFWLLGPARCHGELPGDDATWKDVRTERLRGMEVTLSTPVLVARSAGFLWFPTLARLADGDLVAVMSNYQDAHVSNATGSLCWSANGGLTWSAPSPGLYSDSSLSLPGGDHLLLPYYLRPRSAGAMGAACQRIPKGHREAKVVEEGVQVAAWPKPDRSFAPELGLAGFVFNGNTIAVKDGYLAMLYGYFQDAKRYSLVSAVSPDGAAWTIRSTVADENCPLRGAEGPCESAVCRLKDDRLMCVFRLASNVPYGQTFSADEGHTWSAPQSMAGIMSVQPSLAVLAAGPIILTGGRPGLHAWFNGDGAGKDWEGVDLREHHNRCQAGDPIDNPATGTSAYTEVVPLDATHALCIYDRLANGWNAIPEGSNQSNSVWVVRMTVKPITER